MKAAVRSRTQLRNSFIHSAEKLQGGENCRGKEADRGTAGDFWSGDAVRSIRFESLKIRMPKMEN